MSRPAVCYFDNNATTPVAPEVVEALLPFLREQWANPSSPYGLGREVARQLERARSQVAALLHAEPREIVFTSCGTESNNAAIHSALACRPRPGHIVTTAVEHSATLVFCRQLEQQGCSVTRLPVTEDGALDLALLEAAIRPDTALVSIMWANNETGLLFPVREVATICHRHGVLFHTDAVQVPGKLEIDVRELDADFLSLSAHKLYAPKGVGLLYVRRGPKFKPYIVGGRQERGRRGGTENVAGAAAFGRAAELAEASLHDETVRVRGLRDKLEQGVLGRIPGAARNGPAEPRLPNTANIAFEDVEAEGLLLLLDQAGICVSSGSACTSGAIGPSHVLTAMGCNPARARGSLRFSLGRQNTEEEVDYLLNRLPGIVERLRAQSGRVAGAR